MTVCEKIIEKYQFSVNRLMNNRKCSTDDLLDNLKKLKDEKLEIVHNEISKDYVKRYKEEQEEIMRIGINLSAYQISFLEKVSFFNFNFFRRN